MPETPKITFDGTTNRQYILKDGTSVGTINAIYGEGSQVTGYAVYDQRKDQSVNSSCSTMNQAKAFAEYHFGKEAQS